MQIKTKLKPLASAKIKIHSTEWEFICISEKGYNAEFGDDSAAICLTEKKQVYIQKNELTPKTIMHELIHCLVEEHNLTSANLNQDQFEEFICELMPSNYYNLGSWTNELFHKLHR